MTMNKMVEELEKEGFITSRTYESKEKQYRFEIQKDGIREVGYFVYRPSGESYSSFVNRQRNFITTLINSWKETKAAKSNTVNFNTELFNRGGRAYICLETGKGLGIPVCIEQINYTSDTLPSFEGHFCDVLSEYVTTKTNNSQIEIKEDKDNTMKIKVVHFSGPVTTVIWEDGTKSQVRCQDGDDFDYEKGLALAIAKRVLGNKGSWYDEIKKWTEPYHQKAVEDAYDNFLKMFGIDLKKRECRIGNLNYTYDNNGNATVTYVGPQDSDEAKRVESSESPTDTTPIPMNAGESKSDIRCATCQHVDKSLISIPCSNCDMNYSCWEIKEETTTVDETPQATHYNPIEEAYNLALKIRDGKDGNIESIIGFLGEALAD